MTINKIDRITVLATGGTIDKVYSLQGELEIGDPSVPQLLAPVLTDIEFTLESVLRLDSLDMEDSHRAVLVNALEKVTDDHIIITHGTDTMPETARYIHQYAQRENKVIVLCGAMQPASMRSSDAGFNFGMAVGAMNLLSPGVYICMSGKVFSAEEVHKDRSRGIFVSDQ
ncbi:asparaginase domain-containing protein [Rothia sp. P7181]|uniref:asparaginase domain-containing protein n=1 Tax=unclassified Rothia (in: high G+C Gram-positive bacteria) TaxID=2689056 RepID=UPI003AD5794F